MPYKSVEDRRIFQRQNYRKKVVKESLRKKRWRKANHSIALFKNARDRAKRNSIAFNLTEEDVVIPNFCPILGIPLKLNEGSPKFDSPSIDRIIPSLGYIKGNIIIISNKANMIKSSATPDEILKVALFYKELIKTE